MHNAELYKDALIFFGPLNANPVTTLPTITSLPMFNMTTRQFGQFSLSNSIPSTIYPVFEVLATHIVLSLGCVRFAGDTQAGAASCTRYESRLWFIELARTHRKNVTFDTQLQAFGAPSFANETFFVTLVGSSYHAFDLSMLQLSSSSFVPSLLQLPAILPAVANELQTYQFGTLTRDGGRVFALLSSKGTPNTINMYTLDLGPIEVTIDPNSGDDWDY